jgi:hypothetical protein
MRLGLVTDVHNHAAFLFRALTLFRETEVDQIVTIGDTHDAFSSGEGADQVAALLDECGATGVWGNHDFTLCRDVPERIRARCTTFLLQVMARMQPRLVIGDCHFSHKEASVDPNDVAQLWDISEHPLDLMERARSAFAANASPWQFVGHYHRWWAATPAGPLAWTGTEPLYFEQDMRYFVVVAAVFDGWCGVLDTEVRTLTPIRCGTAIAE